ncbi:hypothetical protein NEMBOFW57_000649 [Staphylotrichum longicolle]|uniref:SAM-dependent MTase RsmB/NOP-type domain-containing protein n=1 Tax=Staphylotrichum longicolle TaxID=669026 RepID=A0AAD4F067_9PEZI|nr:hypothetical protein NEMBOFW57_000649 [Staphylotrichum longicolle]
MSLYHETVGILTSTATHTGSLKSRIYGSKDLKSPPAQVYALAFESSKWSAILKEVVEKSQLLQKERKLTPALSILLVHDLLLAKKGIALPASHGLRVTVEKHKARLQSEFTRARIRRKCPTVDALRAMVDAELGPAHPRWIRVNTLKSTLDEQLDTTFKGFEMVPTVEEVMASASTGKKVICLDGHVPNLIAASPGVDFTKTEAYKAGALILQDKASCFPAYLLDPRPEDGDIIDACSAPGNKTTHLAGILHERGFAEGQRILAFEKDKHRAKTLERMVATAGSSHVTLIHPGHDFLKTNPNSPEFRSVGALLLDPSCSGSGIVGRDDTPEFHLPSSPSSLHAFAFPPARKVTYSTCSVHAAENEGVVLAALASDVARVRGWRVRGLREWDVRGEVAAAAGDEEVAAATGRKAVELDGLDGEGVEVRFGSGEDDAEGPFERDAGGRIVRGPDGMPRLKAGKGRVVDEEDGDEDADEDDEGDADDEWGGFDD